MENPEHLESSDQVPVQEDFQNANAIIESISQPKDSQPTKLRVKNFKNRVFHLVKIFTTNSTNVNPLLECIKQQMFLREPEKMRELVNQVLKKQNIDLENLQHLLQYHKVILLYKNDKIKGDGVAIDFIKVLKKLSLVDSNIVQETVLDLLKSFALVRKSKLNINFFFYFFRNFQGGAQIRKLLLEKCQEYINDPKLRNAQKKQLTKLKNKLDRSTKTKTVKKEEEQQQSEDDQIKVVEKKKNPFSALKVQKKQEKVQKDKIEEQGEIQKPKKEISSQQKEKLQRMKDNKKKSRKQNKSKPKNEHQNGNKNGHKNGQSTSQQKKVNNPSKGNEQKTHSNQKRDFSKQKVSKNKFHKK